MKQTILTILIALCALAGTATTAQAETITKTYRFSGGTAGSQTTFQGYFYEEGKNTHYTSSPSPWTYGDTPSISFTLADGIKINFASSNKQIFVEKQQCTCRGWLRHRHRGRRHEQLLYLARRAV